MMDTVKFALWKFKTIEGQIECNGYDFNTTKIQNGFNVYYITYDPSTEMATIKNATNPMFETRTVPFAQLVEKLKTLGIWRQRPEIDQHSSARVPL